MSISAYVSAIDIQIAKCREIDTANAISYDAAYATYHQDLGDILVRINFLLTEEAGRLGMAADFFTRQLPPFLDAGKREAARMAETNPGMYLAMCRSLPKAASQHTDLFRPLHEKYPDDMRLIDEWR